MKEGLRNQSERGNNNNVIATDDEASFKKDELTGCVGEIVFVEKNTSQRPDDNKVVVLDGHNSSTDCNSDVVSYSTDEKMVDGDYFPRDVHEGRKNKHSAFALTSEEEEPAAYGRKSQWRGDDPNLLGHVDDLKLFPIDSKERMGALGSDLPAHTSLNEGKTMMEGSTLDTTPAPTLVSFKFSQNGFCISLLIQRSWTFSCLIQFSLSMTI